jgi:hypothetical protein
MLIGLGAVQCTVDKAVFYWLKDECLEGVMSCHVDDMFWGGKDSFLRVIEGIRKEVTVGTEESNNFLYSGLQIRTWDSNGVFTITMDLFEYTQNIAEVTVPNSEPHTPLSEEEVTDLRGIVGELSWVGGQSRPDLSFRISVLSSAIADPQVKHLTLANTTLKAAKRVQYPLSFPQLGANIRMKVFTDAAHANREDGSSQRGVIIFLTGDSGLCIPLSWSSKKLRRVTRSTFAGEALGVVEGVDECMFLAHLWLELNPETGPIPIDLYTDSKGLWDFLNNHKRSTVEQRIRTDMAALIQDLTKGNIASVNWVCTGEMLADPLTKMMNSHWLVQTLTSSKISLTQTNLKLTEMNLHTGSKKKKRSVKLAGDRATFLSTVIPYSTRLEESPCRKLCEAREMVGNWDN